MVVSSPDSHGRGWAVVRLKEIGEDLHLDILDADLTRLIPGVRIYAPAQRGAIIQSRHPVSEYAFVTLKDFKDIQKIRHSRYVESVLTLPGKREAIRVSDDDLKAMADAQIRGVYQPGDAVRILEGDAAGLLGTVTQVLGRKVEVEVKLRSRTYTEVVRMEDVQPVDSL